MNDHFAVIGATSWGLTLGSLLRANGHRVTVLTRDADEAASLDASHTLDRLPGITLARDIAFRASAERVGCDGYVLAAPAQHAAASLTAAMERGTPILSAAKGIEAGGRRMSEVIGRAGWPEERISVLAGPNLAREVVVGLPAAAVVASAVEAEAGRWQQAFANVRFRVYRSTDVVGVEVAGAMKNVIAIAAGACTGLGLGANAVAAVMTRGLAEMTRLGVALGADPLTFQGLAGVGDLAATCFSPLSRNHRFGALVASGKSPAEAQAEIGEAVEGAATAPVATALARAHGVELPIAEVVATAIAGEIGVAEAMMRLLSRPLTVETPATGGC